MIYLHIEQNQLKQNSFKYCDGIIADIFSSRMVLECKVHSENKYVLVLIQAYLKYKREVTITAVPKVQLVRPI